MEPTAIQSFAGVQSGLGRDAVLSASQRSFAGVLGRAERAASPEAQARESAEQLVAVAFIQPMLKELRDNNHAPPPWAPTQGEKMFGGLADAELAQRLVKASRFPLVERIERDLMVRVRGAQGAASAGLQRTQGATHEA